MTGAGLRWNGVFLVEDDTEAKGFEVEEEDEEEEDKVELILVGTKLEDLPTKPLPEPPMELLLLLEPALLFLLDLKVKRGSRSVSGFEGNAKEVVERDRPSFKLIKSLVAFIIDSYTFIK